MSFFPRLKVYRLTTDLSLESFIKHIEDHMSNMLLIKVFYHLVVEGTPSLRKKSGEYEFRESTRSKLRDCSLVSLQLKDLVLNNTAMGIIPLLAPNKLALNNVQLLEECLPLAESLSSINHFILKSVKCSSLVFRILLNKLSPSRITLDSLGPQIRSFLPTTRLVNLVLREDDSSQFSPYLVMRFFYLLVYLGSLESFEFVTNTGAGIIYKDDSDPKRVQLERPVVMGQALKMRCTISILIRYPCSFRTALLWSSRNIQVETKREADVKDFLGRYAQYQ